MSFKVQEKACATCIYRTDNVFDIQQLEAQIADRYGGFKSWRICHHSIDACCAVFWAKHKDEFPTGQVAQRLNVVEFVNVDVMED